MNGDDKRESDSVKTAERMFEVIEYVKENKTVGVTEIAEGIGLSKSTVHRHLSTLEQLEYVSKVDGKYRLSLQFLDLGENARMHEDLYRFAKPEIDELATRTGERVQVMVEENYYGRYVYQSTGEKAIKTNSHIGQRVYLNTAAVGKAYLAFKPREYVEEVIQNVGLFEETPNSLNTPEQLFEDLETIAERGFALNDEETKTGMRAVGAPIYRENDGDVLGSISLAAPKFRLKEDRFRQEIPDQLGSVAEVIGLKATYS